MLERFLLGWLVLLSVIAFLWNAFLPAAWDPFKLSAPYLWHLIAVTMLAIGWMLPREEVRQVAARWPLVCAGTAVQYLSMPLLALGVAWLFGLRGDTLTGVIIVGCVPGAMASNVLTLMARGNVSYSLSLTTLATLLSPLTVPLILQLALGRRVPVPVNEIMIQLVLAIVLPVVAGYLLGQYFSKWEQTARKVGSTIANLTILWIIAVVVALNRERVMSLGTDVSASATLISALLAINLLGYATGYTGGLLLRLPEPMRRALTLEIGMQNAGLGATLAAFYFGKPAAIPAAMFTFGCMFTGTILARAWATHPPAKSDQPKVA